MAVLVNYDIALGKQVIKDKSQGTTTVTEAPIKQGEIKEVKLPPIKKEPPFNVGDIIGYSEPELPERYVGKIALFARWAWQVEKLKGGEIWEPKSIEIDDQQNVYIYHCEYKEDKNNEIQKIYRINKYNNKGEYLSQIKVKSGVDIAVDNSGIYVYSIKTGITKYSNKGTIIKEYSFPEYFKEDLIKSVWNRIWIDEGDIFIGFKERPYKISTIKDKILFLKKYSYIIKNKEAKIEYIPRPDLERDFNEICLEVKKRGESKGVIRLKIPKEFPEWANSEEATPEEKHELKQIIGIDREGCIYALVKEDIYPLYYIKYSSWTVYKYNFKGELMAEIELIGPGLPIPLMNEKDVLIDKRGNIYQLREIFVEEGGHEYYKFIQEKGDEGIYLIKWEIVK
jgi:hypothetical protein